MSLMACSQCLSFSAQKCYLGEEEMTVWYTIYHHLPIGCEGSLTFLYIFHPHVVVCTLHADSCHMILIVLV